MPVRPVTLLAQVAGGIVEAIRGRRRSGGWPRPALDNAEQRSQERDEKLTGATSHGIGEGT